VKVCQTCSFAFETEDWICPRCNWRPEAKNGCLIFAPASDNPHVGFNSEVFEGLYHAEKGNFWFRVRNEIIGWAMGRYFPAATQFLEIGCGTGFVLRNLESKFPHLSCAGSELQSRGLVCAKQRVKGASLWQMDARNIPFQQEFDVIGAFDVLEHIAEDQSVLAQMNKALAPGGGILLTVPQHPILWSAADGYAHHERRYRASELKQKVVDAGFRVTRSTSFVTFLLPFMVLSRLASRFSKSAYDPQSELVLPRWLDWLFEGVMKLELVLIRAGLSLPLGGSLLLIAHKVDDR